jgi:hypothetical protein
LGAPLLSVLMIARTRYPKLSVYPSILVPTLAGLMIMPFAYTVSLAAVTLVLIAVYVLAGPAMVPQRPGRDAPPQGVRVEHAAEGRQSA